MTQDSTSARHAAWLFLAAPAFLAIPAHGQDATTQDGAAPPPVVRTVPPSTDAARTTTTSSTPAPATSTVRGADPNSTTPVAPGAADVVDDARIAAQAERRGQPRRDARRPVSAARTTAPAAAVATTAAATAPTTPATAQAQPAEPAAAPAAQPAAREPAATSETTTKQTTEDGGAPLWPLGVIVALIVAVGAFFLLRRRKADAYEEEAYYEEPVHADPAPVAAATLAATPVAAAPVAAAVATAPNHHEPVAAGLADEAVVASAPAEDVAALTDGTPPVNDRPWLELAMRPIRAGTSADEAMVEIELTVANSGSVAAQDVRVSTFMLTDAHASEMENMLVDPPADATIDPVTIEPGEGTRIDATLAALKSDLGGEGRFTPVVIADARYRLPDGREGRTSASFVVGVSDDEGGTLIPIDLADRVMREDVEARLHGAPEHA